MIHSHDSTQPQRIFYEEVLKRQEEIEYKDKDKIKIR